jgi:hypothetical protein
MGFGFRVSGIQGWRSGVCNLELRRWIWVLGFGIWGLEDLANNARSMEEVEEKGDRGCDKCVDDGAKEGSRYNTGKLVVVWQEDGGWGMGDGGWGMGDGGWGMGDGGWGMGDGDLGCGVVSMRVRKQTAKYQVSLRRDARWEDGMCVCL